MRVTMLVRCLAMMRGGGETRHLAWARELTALGVDVEIITGVPLVSGDARYPIDGGRHRRCSGRPYARDFVYRWQHRRGFGRLTMTALHLDEELFCRAAWRRIAAMQIPPDIVHAHALHQAARLRRGDIPVVINLPGPPNPRYVAICSRPTRWSPMVGRGASAGETRTAGRAGAQGRRYRAVSVPTGRSCARRLGSTGRRVVLAVARLVPIKNVRLLLDALAIVRGAEPNAHLRGRRRRSRSARR